MGIDVGSSNDRLPTSENDRWSDNQTKNNLVAEAFQPRSACPDETKDKHEAVQKAVDEKEKAQNDTGKSDEPGAIGERDNYNQHQGDVTVTARDAAAARNRYLSDVKHAVVESSLSPAVLPGESYSQVLHRMFPELSNKELSALALEVKRLNGGRNAPSEGARLETMNTEQRLRLIDKIMNDYDDKHGTQALDIYGDFARERGKSAPVHEKIRQGLSEKIEKQVKEPVVTSKPEQPGTPSDSPSPDKPGADKPGTDKPGADKPTGQTPPDNRDKNALMGVDEKMIDKTLLLFPKIDLDQNGILSKAELQSAAQSGQFKDQEAQIVAGLAAEQGRISKVDSRGWFFDKEGISKTDIVKLGSQIGSMRQYDVDATLASVGFTTKNDKTGQTLFEQTDENKDGYVSFDELMAATSDEHLTEQQRSDLRFVSRNYKSLAESSRGVTLADVTESASKGPFAGVRRMTEAIEVAMKAEQEKQAKLALDPSAAKS